MNTQLLLENNTESYYWMGFLLADGYFDKHKIVLTLSEKDENHLNKFKEFLNIEHNLCYIPSQNAVRLNIGDIKSIREILKKFNWRSRKSYNPPNLDVFSTIGDFNTLCWFIGFIDGDGCIQHQSKRTDTKISIHIHANWMNVLLYIHDLIDRYFKFETAKPRILKSGYLRYDIANMRLIQTVKKFVLDNNLPQLHRKWDKIDLGRIHKHDKANALQKQILNLKSQGFSLKEIATKLNVNKNTLGYYCYTKPYQS